MTIQNSKEYMELAINVSLIVEMLHNNSVVVPLDNAGGNVAFAYQKHYAQVLINDLGLNANNTT